VKFQDDLSIATANAQASVLYGGLLIKCNNANDVRHTVNINPSDLALITYYWTDNCNIQAQWVLNIGGNGDVTLTGDNFPANPGAVVINFLGAGRTLTIQNSVFGSILAPNNYVYQSSGVIIGKIVAGDIKRVHQVNIVHCPTPEEIILKVPTSRQSPAGNIIYLYSVASVRVGDNVQLNGQDSTVTAVNEDNGSIEVSPSHAGIGASSVLNFVVSDPTASRKLAEKEVAVATSTEDSEDSNSASTLSASLALFFALFLLF
jgi:hypothetical protein